MFVILIIATIALTSALEPSKKVELADDRVKNIISKYIEKIPDIKEQYVMDQRLMKAISQYFKGKISSFPLYKISLKIDRNPVKIPWILQAQEPQKDKIKIPVQRTQENEPVQKQRTNEKEHVQEKATNENAHVQNQNTLENEHVQEKATNENAHVQNQNTLKNEHVKEKATNENTHVQNQNTLENEHVQEKATNENAHVQNQNTLENEHVQEKATNENAHVQNQNTLENEHVQKQSTHETEQVKQSTQENDHHVKNKLTYGNLTENTDLRTKITEKLNEVTDVVTTAVSGKLYENKATDTTDSLVTETSVINTTLSQQGELADDRVQNIISKYVDEIPDIKEQYVMDERLTRAISQYFKGKVRSFPLYKINLTIDRNPVKIPWTLQTQGPQKDKIKMPVQRTQNNERVQKLEKEYVPEKATNENAHVQNQNVQKQNTHKNEQVKQSTQGNEHHVQKKFTYEKPNANNDSINKMSEKPNEITDIVTTTVSGKLNEIKATDTTDSLVTETSVINNNVNYSSTFYLHRYFLNYFLTNSTFYIVTIRTDGRNIADGLLILICTKNKYCIVVNCSLHGIE